jgi:hypothetical protein
MCHDESSKSPGDWFRHSEIGNGDLQTQMHSTEIVKPTLNFTNIYTQDNFMAKHKLLL